MFVTFVMIGWCRAIPSRCAAASAASRPSGMPNSCHEMGLDQPIWKQFARLYVGPAAWRFRHLDHHQDPGVHEFLNSFRRPIELSLCAMIFAIVHRDSGRRHRRGEARRHLRSDPDGHRAHRLFDADLLVGPDPYPGDVQYLASDTRVGPHRPGQVFTSRRLPASC